MRSFASIAHPLTELTRQGVEFRWGGVEAAAFEQLKAALTSAPVLEILTKRNREKYGLMLRIMRLARRLCSHLIVASIGCLLNTCLTSCQRQNVTMMRQTMNLLP